MPNIPFTAVGRTGLIFAALATSAALADPPHTRARREGVFRDWRLDCASTPCLARTEVRAGDGSVLMSMEGVGLDEGGRIVLRTPLPLLLPDGVTLVLGDAPPRALAWRTCRPDGCETEAPLDEALLASLKRERLAEVTMTLEDGVRVRLPVSLLGFTAAREAALGKAAP